MGMRDQLAADMAAAIGDYGQTFEWKGHTYPCVRRDQPTALELQDAAGFIEKSTAWLLVSKLNFNAGAGPFPQNGDGVDGDSRQIKNVNGADDAGAAQLTISTGSFDE